MVNLNEKAPEFSLKDKDGKIHSLKEINTDYVILYFYPKDDTSGCTLEAKEFSHKRYEFKKLNATILGISGGDEKSKAKFCEKHDIRIPLLSDPDFKVAQFYDAYGEKNFLGVKSKGIFRKTFILDKEHRIIKIFEHVKPEGHTNEIKAFLNEHKRE